MLYLNILYVNIIEIRKGIGNWKKISICRIFGIEINMALLNYEFDRQLELERNDLVQKNICYDGNIDCDGIEGTRQYRILWQLR